MLARLTDDAGEEEMLRRGPQGLIRDVYERIII